MSQDRSLHARRMDAQASTSSLRANISHNDSLSVPASPIDSGATTPEDSTGILGMLTDDLKKLPRDLNVKLHRRKGDRSYRVVAPGTPFDEIDLSEVAFFNEVEHPKPKDKSGLFNKRRFLLPLAGVLGAILAMLFIAPIPPDVLSQIPGFDDISSNLDVGWSNLGESLPDISASWSTIRKDISDALEPARELWKNRDFEVGSRLKDLGLEADHPVILFPGIVSSALESWNTDSDTSGFFRKRIWGTSSMIKAVLSSKARWVRHMSLDPDTGLDPDGVRVRAAQGLDAASQFISGYWIWAKIIENLACIGYDYNNMDLASYDWRLAYYNLEVRDQYFSRMKYKIEMLRRLQNRKTVLIGHSMGSTVILYFLKWVEAQDYGGGGNDWAEHHIEAFVNIGGPMLGVTKAMTAFLSGEMKDTVELNPAAAYVLEKYFSRTERAKLFRTWAGSASMFLKGGDRVWGSDSGAPDDPENKTDTHGRFFSFRSDPKAGNGELNSSTVQPNLTVSDATDFILSRATGSWQKMMRTNYSVGFETDAKILHANGQDHTKWTNVRASILSNEGVANDAKPLEVQLPNAPSMSIFCLYGHGLDTERSYWYLSKGKQRANKPVQLSTGDEYTSEKNSTEDAANAEEDEESPAIDFELSIPRSVPAMKSGIRIGDGDGTVPLISLGAMCVDGWKRKKYNPGQMRVVTREYLHMPEASLDFRGGRRTADHIGMLGNELINEDVLKVAAGKGDELEDIIMSGIKRYASKIAWD